MKIKVVIQNSKFDVQRDDGLSATTNEALSLSSAPADLNDGPTSVIRAAGAAPNFKWGQHLVNRSHLRGSGINLAIS